MLKENREREYDTETLGWKTQWQHSPPGLAETLQSANSVLFPNVNAVSIIFHKMSVSTAIPERPLSFNARSKNLPACHHENGTAAFPYSDAFISGEMTIDVEAVARNFAAERTGSLTLGFYRPQQNSGLCVRNIFKIRWHFSKCTSGFLSVLQKFRVAMISRKLFLTLP